MHQHTWMARRRRSPQAPLSLLLLLTVAATGGCGDGDGDLGEAQEHVSGGPGTHVYVVAHEDDDLLFINPDIQDSILSGHPTTTIFLTAGDPGTCKECWLARENGILNAYSAMIDVAKDWTCRMIIYPGGKIFRRCILNPCARVNVAFMRLPDRPASSLASLWFPDGESPFYGDTPVSQLAAVEGTTTYTKPELVQMLASMFAELSPTRIGTQDSSLAHGEDHWDHVGGGLFALEAAHTLASPYELKMYRGYNIYGNYFTSPTPEAANLTLAQYREKVRIMEAYGGGFPPDSDYDHWSWRRYTIDKLPGGTGPIVQASGLCLDASGSAVQLATCAGSDAQTWSVNDDGTIVGEGGQCLTVGADGVTVLAAACVGTAQQKWSLMDDGQLRGFDGACLGVAADGITVQPQLCAADTTGPKFFPVAAQKWSQQL